MRQTAPEVLSSNHKKDGSSAESAVGEAKPYQSAETQAYDVTRGTEQDRGGTTREVDEVETPAAD